MGVIQRCFQSVILVSQAVHTHFRIRLLSRLKYGPQINSVGFPVSDGRVCLQNIHAPDHLIKRAKAELRHVPAGLFRNHKQVVHNVLGLATEFLAQYRILGSNPNRAGIKVALAHHDAAERN